MFTSQKRDVHSSMIFDRACVVSLFLLLAVNRVMVLRNMKQLCGGKIIKIFYLLLLNMPNINQRYGLKMTKIEYVAKRFRGASLQIIEQANEIIAEYSAQGFQLTLRQIYYQFVARDLIPNTQRDYSRLGSIINDGCLAGLIDWEAIEDRTRNLQHNSHWDSPAEILEACAQSYRIDKWADQPYRIEVWIEKEALAGVIEPTCRDLDVPFFSCRGYVSQSEMWAAAQRFHEHIGIEEQQVVILHFGDHDPSGIDMTRDIADRMLVFEVDMVVDRLALNMDQVEHFNPPPNPAKTTDSRYDAYIRSYGDDSWELDALEPKILIGLIRKSIQHLRNNKKWKASCERETAERSKLAELAEER